MSQFCHALHTHPISTKRWRGGGGQEEGCTAACTHTCSSLPPLCIITQLPSVRTSSVGPWREEDKSGPLFHERITGRWVSAKQVKSKHFSQSYYYDLSFSYTLRSIRYVIKGQALFLLKYHLTDSFQVQHHSLFKLQTKLELCVSVRVCMYVCVCIRLGTVFLSLSPSHTGNLTPLFCRSGPASHLSYLPLPKLRGPSPCTCKPHPVLTCVAWLTCTLIAVDFVYASSIVTGFALTVVQVHLTVKTCRLENKHKIWGKSKVKAFVIVKCECLTSHLQCLWGRSRYMNSPYPGKYHHSCRAGSGTHWYWSHTGGQCSQGGTSRWRKPGHPYRCHNGRGQSSTHWCLSHSAVLCNLDNNIMYLTTATLAGEQQNIIYIHH